MIVVFVAVAATAGRLLMRYRARQGHERDGLMQEYAAGPAVMVALAVVAPFTLPAGTAIFLACVAAASLAFWAYLCRPLPGRHTSELE